MLLLLHDSKHLTPTQKAIRFNFHANKIVWIWRFHDSCSKEMVGWGGDNGNELWVVMIWKAAQMVNKSECGSWKEG
jgi:hypothetical protein